MSTLAQNSDTQDNLDGQSSFALAIAVLRERVRSLSKEDQDDLYELMPALLGDDEEERASASVAVKEILDQAKIGIQSFGLDEKNDSSIGNWLEFVSQKIKQCREDAELTQSELAKITGLPQSHISRLEAGIHSPSHKTLQKIADALNLPIATFDPSL